MNRPFSVNPPKVFTAIGVQIDPTLRQRLDRAARQAGLNRSQFVREVLTDYLDREEGKRGSDRQVLRLSPRNTNAPEAANS